MSYEVSTFQNIDDREAFVERAREFLEQLKDVDPEKIQCLMGIIVQESPTDEDELNVNTFVLGDVDDVRHMLSTLFMVAQNGMAQVDPNYDRDKETIH